MALTSAKLWSITAGTIYSSHPLCFLQISQLKKALVCQAEGVITLSGHCQQLYASQMQLIDLLPDTPLENSDTTAEGEYKIKGAYSLRVFFMDCACSINIIVDSKSIIFTISHIATCREFVCKFVLQFLAKYLSTKFPSLDCTST